MSETTLNVPDQVAVDAARAMFEQTQPVQPLQQMPPEAEAPAAAHMPEPAESNPDPSPESTPVNDEPETPEDWAKKLEVRVIDLSRGVDANAHDYADNRLEALTSERGVKGFIKRVVWGGVGREYKRLKLIKQGRDEQVESRNIHATYDGSQADHDRTAAAIVSGFSRGFTHGGQESPMANVEHGHELEEEIHGLTMAYAVGDLDMDSLVEERTRLLDSYGSKLKAEDRNTGLLFADNILEVAQNAKAAYEHEVGIDAIDAMLRVYKGDAQTGARTEVKRTISDRIVDKVHSTKLGALVNETTIVGTVGALMVVKDFTTRKLLYAAGAFVSLGAAGAVIAGAREHANVGRRRQTQLREQATGAEVDPNGRHSKLREKLAESAYSAVSAVELTDRLTQAREAVSAAEPDSINDILANIGATQARIDMSDEQAVDLISFTNKIEADLERDDLDMAVAEAKVAARRALTGATEAELAAAGLDSRDIDELLATRSNIAMDLLSEDISAKDRIFNKTRRMQTLKMAGLGLATGVGFGLALQEARALVSDDIRGIGESQADGQNRRTLLAAIFRGDARTPDTTHLGQPGANGSSYKFGPSGAANLPQGYHINPGANGEYSLIDAKDHAVGSFHLGADGQIDPASHDALQQAGFKLSEQTTDYTTVDHITNTITQTPAEYQHTHPVEFTTFHRDLWYDNNTTRFDQNELRMDWGGQNGTGLDKDGNYVFDVHRMLPGGSSHDGLTANDRQLLSEGKLKVALSMSKGSQHHVVMVNVNPDFTAKVDSKGFVGRSLFSTHDGQAHFDGAYAETIEVTKVQPNGETTGRILATVVGDNKPKMASVTNVTEVLNHHNLVTTTIEAPTLTNGGNTPIEIPGVLPITYRRGLEALNQPEAAIPYGYVETYSGDQARRAQSQRSTPFAPELAADPDAVIDANVVTTRYLRALRPSYRHKVVELNSQLEKQPKATNPRTIVMIPAAAHQEGNNIYTTLEQYGAQEGIDRETFEVVVFANYPAGAKRDKTIKEVERFQEEHPEIKVRLIQQKLEPTEAKIGWVRKAMADAVLVDAQKRGLDLNDLLLVTNDADAHWINPNYLKTMRTKADESPETDAFLGFIEWGHDAYKAYPEILMGTRFMQQLDIQFRMQGRVASSGANFAYRPGMYAAVGGYRADKEAAEDVMLGRSLRSARSGATDHTSIAFAGMSTQIRTSARRAVDVFLKDGGSASRQWRSFSATDDLRTKEFDMTPFDFTDPVRVAAMVEATQEVLNETLRTYSDSLQDSSVPTYRAGRLTAYAPGTTQTLTRLLGGLGVQVRWNSDGSMKIVNSDRMIQKMRAFQATH
jgi:hypothetical protein